LYLIDQTWGASDELHFVELLQSGLYAHLGRIDISHAVFVRGDEAVESGTLALFICLESLQLLIHCLHELGQFDFIFIPFFNQLLLTP